MAPQPRPTFGLSKEERRLLAEINVAEHGLELHPGSEDFQSAKVLYKRNMVVQHPLPGYQAWVFRPSQLGRWVNSQRTAQ